MDNTFIECMVRREDQQMRILKKAGMIVGALILNAAVLLLYSPVLSVSLAVTCFAFFLFWRRIDREYEVIYTNGLLDFDVIYGKSTRKRLLSIDAKQFQFISPSDSLSRKQQIEASYDKTMNFGRTKEFNEASYVGVAKKDEKDLKIIFEPNERMIEALRRYIPNKFEMRR